MKLEERQGVGGNWLKQSKGGEGVGPAVIQDIGKIGRTARGGRGING